MSEPVIELAGVDKAYRFFRLTGLNLQLEAGQVMGLVGPNGAGKSTTLRILMGMVRPDRKKLTYYVDFTKALQTRRLTMGVADGRVEADGETIYLVKDMKVALSEA